MHKDSTVTPHGKPSPIKANTTAMSFNRKDKRQLSLPLTPADRANADTTRPPTPRSESEGRP